MTKPTDPPASAAAGSRGAGPGAQRHAGTAAEEAWPRRQIADRAEPAPAVPQQPAVNGSGAPEQAGGDGQPWGRGQRDQSSTTARLVLVLALVVFAAAQFGLSALYIVGALLVSIVLHEFGHFWVARRSGMKVTEFFVGFGPKLWSFTRGEVTYGLKAIPAGAYVRIVGMNAFEDVDPDDEARTYRAQGMFKRLFTVLAGPAMNLLIAFVLMAAVFLAHGHQTDQWSVGGVPPGTAAAAAGVRTGDRILAVDGEQVGEWDQFRSLLAARAGTRATFTIERGGQRFEQPVDLGWRLAPATAAAFPSQPALSRGDVIESADGRALPRYEDLRSVLAEQGAPVVLRIVRSAPHPTDPDAVVRNAYTLTVNRPLALPENGSAGFLGVEPATEQVRETPIGALGEASRFLGNGVAATVSMIGHVFSPSGISSQVNQLAEATQPTTTLAPGSVGRLTPVDGSPEPTSAGGVPEDRLVSLLGILRLGSEAADIGLVSFLLLVAGVNLALALINLVPMLPLDGGHAAIAIYEGVRGRLRGQPYRADLTKLMPFVYGFIAVLIVLGGTTMLLDALQPPSLR